MASLRFCINVAGNGAKNESDIEQAPRRWTWDQLNRAVGVVGTGALEHLDRMSSDGIRVVEAGPRRRHWLPNSTRSLRGETDARFTGRGEGRAMAVADGKCAITRYLSIPIRILGEGQGSRPSQGWSVSRNRGLRLAAVIRLYSSKVRS